MRHRKKFNHLGRKPAHRKAMLANMASSLILNKKINTTLAKAKALRMYVEPLLTKSKSDSTHSRRVVFSYLKDKYAVAELFRNVASKIADRPGGYTRILKTVNRLGDNAEMCLIELVDYNENMLKAAETKAKPARRTRRQQKKKKIDMSTVAEAKEDVSAVEEAKEDISTDIKEEQVDTPPPDVSDVADLPAGTSAKAEAKEEATTDELKEESSKPPKDEEEKQETKKEESPKPPKDEEEKQEIKEEESSKPPKDEEEKKEIKEEESPKPTEDEEKK